jgi:phage repressor protein C with HTH and peptisase S24 domain
VISGSLTYTINPLALQEWLRSQLQLKTQNDLAKELQIARPLVGSILKGQTRVKGNTLKAFAKKLGISDRELLQQVGAEVQSEHPNARQSDDFAYIPVYDISAGAGNGSYAGDIMQTLAFDKNWLRSQFGTVDSLEGIKVSGDSMEPTLRAGDIVLLNRNEILPRDGVYVIRIDHNLFVKRLQKLPGDHLEVCSDNPIYPKFTIDLANPPSDFQVLGRVVMKCQML